MARIVSMAYTLVEILLLLLFDVSNGRVLSEIQPPPLIGKGQLPHHFAS